MLCSVMMYCAVTICFCVIPTDLAVIIAVPISVALLIVIAAMLLGGIKVYLKTEQWREHRRARTEPQPLGTT